MAQALARTGIGGESEWRDAERAPLRFLELSLERWLHRLGADEVADEFQLYVSLGTSLAAGAGPYVADGRWFLTVEPQAAAYIALGQALDVLAAEAPSLARIFMHWSLTETHRWMRPYTPADAQQWSEWAAEVAAEMGEEGMEAYDIPASLPEALRPPSPPPMVDLRDMEAMDRRKWAPDVGRLLDGARKVWEATTADDPSDCWPEDMHEVAYDLPLPSLLAVIRHGDDTEACFNHEMEQAFQVIHAPGFAVQMRPHDLESVARAFELLTRLVAVCQAWADLMQLVRALDGTGEASPARGRGQ